MSTASLTCAGCGNVNPADATQCLACGQALQGNTTVSRSLTGLLTADHLLKQRYRIIAQIGKGGFGAVYQAADSAFRNRLVAIKEMSQNRLTPQEMAEATQAFKREALLLAELRHPNLPRIYDHFSDAGRWYLVMDFLEGETLEERLHSLSGRGLPGEEVLDIGIQLCSVLEYLHTRQPPIIFRDLKPANVMRTPAGHLYLIDFGIARHFKPGQIKDTMPLGSPGYAAPEQYGKGQTTPRADIYSLGVTLYQLLTGSDPAQTPFRLAPLQLSGHPVLSQLETLIKHMSELDEANRPQSIAVVTQALQRLAKQQLSEPQRGVPHHVPSTPQTDSSTGTPLAEAQDGEQQLIMLGSRQRDPLPRHGLARRSVFIGAGAGLLALAGGGMTWRWLARSQPTAIPARRPIPTSLSQATAHYTYRGHADWVDAVAWSPEGKRIASASRDKTVQIWGAFDGNHPLTYRGHWATVRVVAWSPEGQRIASGGDDGTVQVWDASWPHSSGKVLFKDYGAFDGPVYTLAWSPEGRRIASAGTYDGTVQVWDLMTGLRLLSYRGHSARVQAVAWSPNGNFLAVGSSDQTVQVLDRFDGGLIYTYRGHTAEVTALAWSPEGQRIASASQDTTVQVWTAQNGRSIFTYTGHTAAVLAVVWLDSRSIASGSADHTVQMWQLPVPLQIEG